MRLFPRKPEDLFAPVSGHPIETIAALDVIPIDECGEPLANLHKASPTVFLRARSGASTLWARTGTAEHLNRAQDLLNAVRPGWKIVVWDAYRPLGRQKRMHYVFRGIVRITRPLWSNALVREYANKYVATPDAVHPPPHSTGGALDVALIDEQGRDVPLDWPLLFCAHADAKGIMPAMRENRRLLWDAMNEAGFSNYEEEWWHWSWGDSGWALRTGAERAIYGPVPAAVRIVADMG